MKKLLFVLAAVLPLWSSAQCGGVSLDAGAQVPFNFSGSPNSCVATGGHAAAFTVPAQPTSAVKITLISRVASPSWAAVFTNGSCDTIFRSGPIGFVGDTSYIYIGMQQGFRFELRSMSQDSGYVVLENSTATGFGYVYTPCSVVGIEEPVETLVWMSWDGAHNPPLKPGFYWNGSRKIIVK